MALTPRQEAAHALARLEPHPRICRVCSGSSNYRGSLCTSCWCWADSFMNKHTHLHLCEYVESHCQRAVPHENNRRCVSPWRHGGPCEVESK